MMNSQLTSRISRTLTVGIGLAALILILLGVLTAVLYRSNLSFIDWTCCYLPAVQQILNGHSPYSLDGIYNPPWTFILLSPLAILPERLSGAANASLFLLILMSVAARLKAHPLSILLISVSPPALYGIGMSNIDWLIPLGAVLPPSVGLFFVLTKPQIGLPIAIYWFYVAWRNGRWVSVGKTFGPLILVFILSVIFYGFWPKVLLSAKTFGYGNMGIFPWGVPIGIGLLIYAIKKGNLLPVFASGPLIAPYIVGQSFSIPLLSVCHSYQWTGAVVLILWILKLTGDWPVP